MTKYKDLLRGIESLKKEADDLANEPIETAVSILLEARVLDELIKDLKSQSGEIYKKLKEEVIPSKFEEAGCTSITVNGHRFTKSETFRASMKDKVAGYDWLRDNYLEDLITETVNSSTLSATARTLLEEGKELPEDVFNVYILQNTSVTKV